MTNTFLRPLAVHYVDAFEKKCQTQQIPAKFLPQPDNYKKRTKKQETDQDSLSINQVLQEVASPHIQEPIRKTIYTIQQMTEPIVSMQRLDKEKSTKRGKTIKVNSNPSYDMICCQAEPEQAQICEKCFEALCPNCLDDIQQVRTHTRCLQKLCADCKGTLKIDFPNYSIRNYPINLKNFTTLHFFGCTCPQCTKG